MIENTPSNHHSFRLIFFNQAFIEAAHLPSHILFRFYPSCLQNQGASIDVEGLYPNSKTVASNVIQEASQESL